jgi:DNA-binding IclR family transcriptional regulator
LQNNQEARAEPVQGKLSRIAPSLTGIRASGLFGTSPSHLRKMTRQSKGIQSIEHGFRLLKRLQDADGPLPLKELAAGAGMSPSTAHFYLSSYVRLGLVVQAGVGGHYDLGPAALRLGLAALSRFDIVRRAREAMFDLRKVVDGAILLSVWGNAGPTIINHLDGVHTSLLEGRVGMVLPALSATGSVFLAHFPDDVSRKIIGSELTRAGLSRSPRFKSVKDVERVLRDVRKHGVACIGGLYGIGYMAVAAPIYDHEGAVRAVLTALADKSRSDVRIGGKLVKSLLAITNGVSMEVGWKPPPQELIAPKSRPPSRR